jgi:PEP-CTERM motif
MQRRARMKNTKRVSGRAASIAGVILSMLVFSSHAVAQGVDSDRLRVTLPSGAVLFDQTLIEGQETGTIGIGFSPPQFSDTTVFLDQVLVLLEPGTSIVSDRVWVEVQPAIANPILGPQNGVNIFMCSDSTEGVAPPFAFTCPTSNVIGSIPETGALQDVTSFFTILTGSGLRVEVQSDIGDQVPEPATLLLLSAGVAGLAGYGRSRRRT